MRVRQQDQFNRQVFPFDKRRASPSSQRQYQRRRRRAIFDPKSEMNSRACLGTAY